MQKIGGKVWFPFSTVRLIELWIPIWLILPGCDSFLNFHVIWAKIQCLTSWSLSMWFVVSLQSSWCNFRLSWRLEWGPDKRQLCYCVWGILWEIFNHLLHLTGVLSLLLHFFPYLYSDNCSFLGYLFEFVIFNCLIVQLSSNVASQEIQAK